MGQEFVTRAEFKKHKDVNWRRAHKLWKHLKDYVPGWGYSKAEIDAFFEGEDGGKKQVHWNRVTGKPGTYPPSAHTLASHSTKAHAELTDVTSDQHHAKVHNILSADHGDSLADNVVRGDILIGNSTPKWSRLAKGTAGQYLKSNGTDPLWVTMAAADLPNHATRHKKTGADEIKLDEFGEPTDNINLNVSTSRHGLHPKLSGHGAECLTGDGAWLRLYDSTSIVIKVLSKVSDNTRNSNDAEKQTDIQSYSKLKETKIGEPTGAMKVYFELKSSDGETVYGKIYKNGVPVGAEKSTTSTDYVDHEDSLSPLDTQDLIQVYAYSSDPDTMVYVRNLRFKYDRSINMLGDNSLENPLAIEEESQTPFSMQSQDP